MLRLLGIVGLILGAIAFWWWPMATLWAIVGLPMPLGLVVALYPVGYVAALVKFRKAWRESSDRAFAKTFAQQRRRQSHTARGSSGKLP